MLARHPLLSPLASGSGIREYLLAPWPLRFPLALTAQGRRCAAAAGRRKLDRADAESEAQFLARVKSLAFDGRAAGN
jgi:hypothetical protein